MAAQRKRRKRRRRKNGNIRVIVGAIAVLAAILIGALVFFALSADEEKRLPGESLTQESDGGSEQSGAVNPLTGLYGFDGTKLGSRPIAVMVNNAPAARPQWGLCSPDLVFEGVVEGGATRMMWVYADVDDIPKVGSVRSARHDFVELAEGMDALFVHWGGSDLAYDAIRQRAVDDIDGLKYEGKYFFRDNTRNVATEHRGYTTGEDIRKAIDALGRRTEQKAKYREPFSFEKEGAPRTLSGGVCQSVSFDFSSSGSYSHTFHYDAQEGLYYNRIGGEPMRDADGKQMAVSNVILLYCGVRNTGDSSGHMEMDLSGGSGVYISNGSYESIRWEKGSPSSPLTLKNEKGEELTLNAGKSYIGLIPTSRKNNVQIS